MGTAPLHPAHVWSGNSTSPLLQPCDGFDAEAVLMCVLMQSLEGRYSPDTPHHSSHKQGECLVRVNKAWKLLQEASLLLRERL